jgi:hypothetical protein
MSWEMHEAAKKIADGWYSELDTTRKRNAVLERENAKLRELVRRYVEYTSQDRCEGCVCKSRCNEGDIEECWQLTEIRGLARELGIEVDA